jgi:GT2 family glycosyltransferase
MSRVGIVTVLYNSAGNLPGFVESLRAQEGVGWALVAVDCDSPDDSSELLKALLPEAEVVGAGDNLGVAGGNNLGIARALERDFDRLLISNNDITFGSGFLASLLELAAEDVCVAPAVYLAGTELLDDTAGEFDWSRAVWSPSLYGKPAPPGFDQPAEVNMASLTCLLVPAAALRAAGGMDERFWMYYEDFDFVRRVQAAGCRVVRQPAARCWHRKSASSGGVENPFIVYYATRNRLLLMRMYTPWPRFAAFLAWFLATRLARWVQYATRGQWAHARALTLGVFDFLRGRFGRRVLPADG